MKLLIDLFGKKAIKSYWKWLHHKSAFAVWFTFASVVFCGSLYAVAFVDVPSKDKSLIGLYLDNHYETYRLHANSTKLFRLQKEEERLFRICEKLKSQIIDADLLRMRFMLLAPGGSIMVDHEISTANRLLGGLKKSLSVAESSLTRTSLLYDEVFASR